MSTKSTDTSQDLRPQERKLIEFLRSLAYGEVTVKVQDGVPVQIIETKRKIVLG